MFLTPLLTALLFALSVAADPVVLNRSPVTLPLSRRLNVTSPHNLVRHDQARAKALKARGAAKAAGLSIQNDIVINEPIINEAVAYVAIISIGNPPTNYTVVIDSGSGSTCISSTGYKRTSTSTQTLDKVISGPCSGGTEFIDQVTIAPGLTIRQSIEVGPLAAGTGILGIGPVDLTLGTLSVGTISVDPNITPIPTVTDNLFSAGIISAHSIGISFEPAITGTDPNGEITWGGTDSSKFTGAITFIPITATSPANEFWGINQSVRYGASTNILASTAGIFDTGTTLLLIATDGFNKYKTASGAVIDNTTGLLRITSTQFANLQSLFFTAGGTTFEFTANAQIWPRSLNADIGGTAGSIFLVVADLGSPSGQGLDFINGYTFMERFYVVFDTTNKRVGLATTSFTKATTN